MSTSYEPEDTPLDEDERALECLDAAAAYPKDEQDSLLAPYRAEPRRNVTMRLSESVIAGLKSRAAIEGVPYQTLASMVLQKYLRGGFLDREAVQEAVKALKG